MAQIRETVVIEAGEGWIRVGAAIEVVWLSLEERNEIGDGKPLEL